MMSRPVSSRYVSSCWHLTFFPVSYDKDDLQYTWKKDVGTEIYIYDKEMAQFTVFNATRKLKHPLYHSGNNMITRTFNLDKFLLLLKKDNKISIMQQAYYDNTPYKEHYYGPRDTHGCSHFQAFGLALGEARRVRLVCARAASITA